MATELRELIERLNEKATDFGWPSCDAPACIGDECEYECERFDKSVAGHLFDASSALVGARERIAELEAEVERLRERNLYLNTCKTLLEHELEQVSSAARLALSGMPPPPE